MERLTSGAEQVARDRDSGLSSERGGRKVAAPATSEDVARVLRPADQSGSPVEIAGGGTKRGWGGAVQGEVVLETRGLAGVREHSWQDMTATVGAGTTWAAMQRSLSQHGQHVALDPLWPERATVGGVIAANDSGALRLKHGSLRDLVIGMTLVLADGTVARSGGKVVKNVAGYDLHKLMIGAFGTLAVVTEVTFRLHSIPRTTRVWTLVLADADAAGEVMLKVLNSNLSVQAMQVRASAAGYAVDVELAGMDAVLEAHAASLDGLAGKLGVRGESPVFAARERLFEGGGVVVKATMLASAIARVSAEVVRGGGEGVTQATGIMTARFAAAGAERAVAALTGMVAGQGGSVTVLRGCDGLGVLPPAGSSARVMRELKRRFDPKGTLNPGVVVGG